MNRPFTQFLLAALLLLATTCSSSCGRPARGREPQLCSAASDAAGATAAASCRIRNALPSGAANIGSGTLVDVTPDRRRGLVLTCAHLFAEGAGRIIVEFPGGSTHGGLLVAIDPRADLAVVEIASPQQAAVGLNLEPTDLRALRACGFGGDGEYRCIAGQVLGYSESPGRRSVRLAGAVRSGDSGGGVFDEQGRLCAVVWGEAGGITYATTGRPLHSFLNRLLGASRQNQNTTRWPAVDRAVCLNGQCPIVRPAPIVAPSAGPGPAASGPVSDRPNPGGLLPRRPTGPAKSCDCGDRLAAIAERLDGLEQSNRPPDAPPSPLPGGLSGTARAAAAWAAAALGLGGPLGWGLVAAATVGGWIAGRRLARRRQARVAKRAAPEDRPPPTLAPQDSRPTAGSEAAAAAAETFPPSCEPSPCIEIRQPIERDDAEARQLLRLSQLEGRDPLQDALAGRLALDRLDALADSDADPHQQRWADALRRELRERFNDVAPTKFEVTAES